MAQAAQAHADQVWAAVRPCVDVAGAAPLVCRSGCSWCCHQLVAVLPAEVIAIVRYVERTFAPDARAVLMRRLSALDARARGLSPLERARLKQPCAFLVDGACSIHAARPLRCRGVHSRDADHCRWAFEHPDEAAASRRTRARPGPYAVESAEIAHAALTGLARACRETGLDHDMLELNAAARIALNVPDAELYALNADPIFAAAELPDAAAETAARHSGNAASADIDLGP
ncbi:MAG TPA: YkgJ family cysteine cluster protein [Alphaproteobacteria bacterium]